MNTKVNLFPGTRDRTRDGAYADFSGQNVRASKQQDGSFDLETSALSMTDARVFGFGKLTKVANKRSANSPDYRGYLDKPDEGDGAPSETFEVAAWVRPISRGNHAGHDYLSLSLTKRQQSE